ncbi:hypothetical protein [uncultured Agathobaculum sp.]|uniref:hypothetical protein n=1 Tax=uncultured Agathobaculum sp. TaxID=2048140 RepID=UPI00296E3E74
MAEKVENDEICGGMTVRYDENIRKTGRKIIPAKNAAGTERFGAVRFSAQMPVRKIYFAAGALRFFNQIRTNNQHITNKSSNFTRYKLVILPKCSKGNRKKVNKGRNCG